MSSPTNTVDIMKRSLLVATALTCSLIATACSGDVYLLSDDGNLSLYGS